jgi:hypothetical protein
MIEPTMPSTIVHVIARCVCIKAFACQEANDDIPDQVQHGSRNSRLAFSELRKILSFFSGAVATECLS